MSNFVDEDDIIEVGKGVSSIDISSTNSNKASNQQDERNILEAENLKR